MQQHWADTRSTERTSCVNVAGDTEELCLCDDSGDWWWWWWHINVRSLKGVNWHWGRCWCRVHLLSCSTNTRRYQCVWSDMPMTCVLSDASNVAPPSSSSSNYSSCNRIQTFPLNAYHIDICPIYYSTTTSLNVNKLLTISILDHGCGQG